MYFKVVYLKFTHFMCFTLRMYFEYFRGAGAKGMLTTKVVESISSRGS